jgi:hypothetical protein
MHGVDSSIDRRIREIASREGTSINRTAQALLRRALGLEGQGTDRRKEFESFAGQWSKADLAEFESATAAFSEIDAEDWR